MKYTIKLFYAIFILFMIAFQADCAGRPKEAGQEINCLGGSCASKQCAACRLVTRAVLCSSACIGAGVGSQILCPAALHAAATGALYACAGGCAVFGGVGSCAAQSGSCKSSDKKKDDCERCQTCCDVVTCGSVTDCKILCSDTSDRPLPAVLPRTLFPVPVTGSPAIPRGSGRIDDRNMQREPDVRLPVAVAADLHTIQTTPRNIHRWQGPVSGPDNKIRRGDYPVNSLQSIQLPVQQHMGRSPVLVTQCGGYYGRAIQLRVQNPPPYPQHFEGSAPKELHPLGVPSKASMYNDF